MNQICLHGLVFVIWVQSDYRIMTELYLKWWQTTWILLVMRSPWASNIFWYVAGLLPYSHIAQIKKERWEKCRLLLLISKGINPLRANHWEHDPSVSTELPALRSCIWIYNKHVSQSFGKYFSDKQLHFYLATCCLLQPDYSIFPKMYIYIIFPIHISPSIWTQKLHSIRCCHAHSQIYRLTCTLLKSDCTCWKIIIACKNMFI